jgi:hypothetical protein
MVPPISSSTTGPLSRDGTIFDAQADPDYRYRLEPVQTIVALQEMRQRPLSQPSRFSTL